MQLNFSSLTSCISVQCSSLDHNYRHDYRSCSKDKDASRWENKYLFGCISATIGGIFVKLYPCTFNACATNNVSLVTISQKLRAHYVERRILLGWISASTGGILLKIQALYLPCLWLRLVNIYGLFTRMTKQLSRCIAASIARISLNVDTLYLEHMRYKWHKLVTYIFIL
jgi:hypothetical protein